MSHIPTSGAVCISRHYVILSKTTFDQFWPTSAPAVVIRGAADSSGRCSNTGIKNK